MVFVILLELRASRIIPYKFTIKLVHYAEKLIWLAYAARNGFYSAVVCLLLAGADPAINDKRGCTVYDLAAETENSYICHILEESNEQTGIF
jgi:hypothetical protein